MTKTSFAHGQLRSIVDRIEALEAEKRDLSADLKEVYAEAKSNGASLPLTAIIEQFYGQLHERGGGRWDNTALIKLLAKD